MKIRTPRIHLMGSSNRDLGSFGQQPKNVFQSSYVKSQTGYYKTSQSLPQSDIKQSKTNNPYKGTHFQQQSLRWNSKAKKKGTQAEWKLQPSTQRLDYSGYLNQQVGDLTHQFKGKDINMFKLNELKHTFIKNNRKKRNMNEYFINISKNGKVGIQEMKKIVKEYGYDVTDDQVKVIFKLSGSKENYLGIDQFIELMTKENIHFKTLKLDGAFGKARKHFQEAIHLIFKNKFNQLNEAFRIYRMRGENIDEQKFHYVMKKLDINDLIVSREERQELFERFSDKDDKNNKLFNVQKLLCAIVEQQQTLKPTYPPKLSDYQDNLMVNQQNNARKRKKNTYFDFKKISSLQYENQLFKAQEVLKEINKIPESTKQIFSKHEVLTKDKVREKVQSLLQRKGINFLKDQYDCFVSYFDFNSNNEISSNQFKQFLQESTKKAQERFQRRTRALPPQNTKKQECYYDQGTAIESLLKIKSKKYNPQMRTLFKQFDRDKDGYISRQQFQLKIQNLAILQKWQVDNLTNYLDPQGKGFTNFKDFANKFTKGQKQPDNLTQSYIKGKSQSQWINTKKSNIKDSNAYTYNVPNKYSAWPERLKRTDFSMIQPSTKAGQFISEDNRFNINEKHNLGQQTKQQKYRIYQNKLRKLVAWNEINQERVQNKQIQEEQRSKGNEYLLRITKQTYEQHCHK